MIDIAKFKPKTVYVTYIAATPEQVWQALIGPDFTRQYFFGRTIEIEPRGGRHVHPPHAGWPRRREGRGGGMVAAATVFRHVDGGLDA